MQWDNIFTNKKLVDRKTGRSSQESNRGLVHVGEKGYIEIRKKCKNARSPVSQGAFPPNMA